ncbi:hypothetical protein SS50377_22639 [Spironucleus salmonicida]|uniref:Uncharacterized protein n=1 Tax=Spironucleus salmonicida TaxID=348837 RepID=V6LSN8_9EUKA|nr:hypothetical protein SS50377_22639 [Spironucleus salmonicida]|eukprot:EST46696.1 Hypothetical protein SS50377_13290 [Spironucleus salmonicida]
MCLQIKFNIFNQVLSALKTIQYHLNSSPYDFSLLCIYHTHYPPLLHTAIRYPNNQECFPNYYRNAQKQKLKKLIIIIIISEIANFLTPNERLAAEHETRDSDCPETAKILHRITCSAFSKASSTGAENRPDNRLNCKLISVFHTQQLNDAFKQPSASTQSPVLQTNRADVPGRRCRQRAPARTFYVLENRKRPKT